MIILNSNLRRASMLIFVMCVIVAACGIYLSKVDLTAGGALPKGRATRDGGYAYLIPSEFVEPIALPEVLATFFEISTDGLQNNAKSTLMMFENGKPLGPPHAPHIEIRSSGNGLFSHWDGALYFSASDNSDVRLNGRVYELRATLTPRRWIEISTAIAAVSGLCALMILLTCSNKRAIGLMILGAFLIGIATLMVGIAFFALGALGTLTALVGAISGSLAPSFDQARSKAPICKRNGVEPRLSQSGSTTASGVRHPAVILVSVALAMVGGAAMVFLSGIWFVMGAGLALAGLLILLNGLIAWTCGLLGLQPRRDWTADTLIVVASITVTFAGLEVYFAYAESAAETPHVVARTVPDPDVDIAKLEVPLAPDVAAAMAGRHGIMTMPKEWERRHVQIPGTARAYYWHNVLHVYDENNFRRAAPFPPKQDGTMRIMIVGDSITYGTGVEQRWTFPSVLQTIMEPEYRIEIVPLGNEGAQSEDIFKNLQSFLPRLKPDLVIYAVCQNDFLNSGEGQYQGGNDYEIPIPQYWKTFFNKRTRVARYLDDGYDTFLRLLRLRLDFYQDIVKDVQGYQQRFARDVKAMNEFVRDQGLPPIVSMVLDQYPDLDGLGYKTTVTAEKYLRAAGMDVIDTDRYYHRYNKRGMAVSRWEGHPNEEAHAIFAAMLRAGLQRNPALTPYRKK